MNEPLPVGFWEAVRCLAEPDELMKFTLIYDGDLASAGNKPQPMAASRIRNEFHDQLAELWDSHIILKQLARTARTHLLVGGLFLGGDEPPVYSPEELPKYDDRIPLLQPGQTDFCAPIQVPAVGIGFVPLVRHSLYLACAVDILLLRHEEPFLLMKNGGDIDGRIKTLFDALRMPDPKDPNYRGDVPRIDPLYVVLEDDALISDVAIRSGRLLGRATKNPHAVRLTVDITIKVLRVFPQNQCLIGG